jgi:hypothetical protein
MNLGRSKIPARKARPPRTAATVERIKTIMDISMSCKSAFFDSTKNSRKINLGRSKIRKARPPRMTATVERIKALMVSYNHRKKEKISDLDMRSAEGKVTHPAYVGIGTKSSCTDVGKYIVWREKTQLTGACTSW